MDTTANGLAEVPSADGQVARYDVIVVGGGAAGLGGALALARARRSVLVIDAAEPRNGPAAHVHNYLGREGTSPWELLATGRREVASYGGEVVIDRVTGIEPVDVGGFRVARLDAPPVEARRLLVTTGLVDGLPDVAGLAERWGNDVVHCPYCHGWEIRDHVIAVLATGPLSVHQALLWRQWTANLTLILHSDLSPSGDQAEQLAALDIDVVQGPASAVEVAENRIAGIRLGDGRVVACQEVVVAPRFTARADLLVQLGLPTEEYLVGDQAIGIHVPADPTGATAVPGVWVAGNVTDPMETVIGAAAAGLRAAHAINFDLITEDARVAVSAG